jgi:hypothetical protein
VLPDKAEAHGMLRVVDNTGEDYLFDASLFENVNDLSGWITDVVFLEVEALAPARSRLVNPRLTGRPALQPAA